VRVSCASAHGPTFSGPPGPWTWGRRPTAASCRPPRPRCSCLLQVRVWLYLREVETYGGRGGGKGPKLHAPSASLRSTSSSAVVLLFFLPTDGRFLTLSSSSKYVLKNSKSSASFVVHANTGAAAAATAGATTGGAPPCSCCPSCFTILIFVLGCTRNVVRPATIQDPTDFDALPFPIDCPRLFQTRTFPRMGLERTNARKWLVEGGSTAVEFRPLMRTSIKKRRARRTNSRWLTG
jgi:hypothetical protein